jgi:hypothetical protein
MKQGATRRKISGVDTILRYGTTQARQGSNWWDFGIAMKYETCTLGAPFGLMIKPKLFFKGDLTISVSTLKTTFTPWKMVCHQVLPWLLVL